VHAGRAQDESENTGELPWVSKGKSSSTFLDRELLCVCVWCNSPLVSEQVYMKFLSGVLAWCVFEIKKERGFSPNGFAASS
jgi:hypothetical protein